MTLKELAISLRKTIEFRYLIVDPFDAIYALSGQKPRYSEEEGYWICDWSKSIMIFTTWQSVVSLDMSEYMDDQGNIDYSKCIVEVV